MNFEQHVGALGGSFFAVVSGPDRVGKSYLVDKLVRRAGAWQVSLPKPRHLWDPDLSAEDKAAVQEAWLSNWYDDVMRFAEFYRGYRRNGRSVRVVVDRSYPDEWVYANVFGRLTWPTGIFDQIDQLHLEVGAKQVIVEEPDLDLMRSRWDDQFPFEHHERLVVGFQRWADTTRLPVIWVRSREAANDPASLDVVIDALTDTADRQTQHGVRS